MKSNEDLLSRVKIASPCHADWDAMRGNDRVRFCGQCQKNVFNFSALTPGETATLIRNTEGRLCARLYRRADGTLLTANCPVGVARAWRKVKSVCSAVAALLFGVGSVMGATEIISKTRDWLGVNPSIRVVTPPPALGGIGPVPMGQVAVQTMGKIAVSSANATPPPNGWMMGVTTGQPPPPAPRVLDPGSSQDQAVKMGEISATPEPEPSDELK